jgi:hypothetical protein
MVGPSHRREHPPNKFVPECWEEVDSREAKIFVGIGVLKKKGFFVFVFVSGKVVTFCVGWSFGVSSRVC